MPILWLLVRFEISESSTMIRSMSHSMIAGDSKSVPGAIFARHSPGGELTLVAWYDRRDNVNRKNGNRVRPASVAALIDMNGGWLNLILQ